MERVIKTVEWFFVVTLSYIASLLGGYDSILELLVTLIVADLLTGLIYAIMKKKVSSSAMELGLVRKTLVFLIILIAYRLDKYVIEMHNGAIALFGVDLSIRTFAIAYYCIKEAISLIENLANIGVPFPVGIKDILIQVSNYSNKSITKVLANWINTKFKINIDVDDNSSSGSEVDNNSNEEFNKEE